MRATTANVNRVLADAGHVRSVARSTGYHASSASIGADGWMTSVSAVGADLDAKATALDGYTATLADAGWDVTRSGYLLIVSDR